MERQEAYPITYGVLGLLAFTGPKTGYDLKQQFDRTMAPMWNAAHSQIYNELRRMAGLGWVEMERQEQESRPDKKVYWITEAGVEALRRWHALQPPRGLQMRDEVLLRFTFGFFADPADLAATLRSAIADHERRIALYRLNQQRLPCSPTVQADGAAESADRLPDPFFVEMARFAIDFEETYLRWLRAALLFVEQRVQAAQG